MMRQSIVHFYSDTFRIEADFYQPEGMKTSWPSLILCGGYGALRQHILPDYAARFVAAGYAVLALDYRGFGGSEGLPNRLMPLEQIQDIRSAISWLQSQPTLDPNRIGVWGTSGGGAHIPTVAALDKRLSCAVGQIGYANGAQMILEHKSVPDQTALLERVREDEAQRALSGESALIRVIDLISDPATVGYVLEVAKTDPSIITYVTLASAQAALEYRPVDVAHHNTHCPIMLIGGSKDEICPMQHYQNLYEQIPAPKKWVEYNVGHYEIYQPEWVSRSAAEAIDWFDAHLKG